MRPDVEPYRGVVGHARSGGGADGRYKVDALAGGAQNEGPGGGGGGATRALLEPVVTLLRSKLQFVTEEAAGRLVLGLDVMLA